MNKSVSLIILAKPDRRDELFNSWSSIQDLNYYFEDIFIIFNGFDSHTHDMFLDMADIRNTNIIKLNNAVNDGKALKSLNGLLKTQYLLCCTDNTIFNNENCIDMFMQNINSNGYSGILGPGFAFIDQFLYNKIDDKLHDGLIWIDLIYDLNKIGLKPFYKYSDSPTRTMGHAYKFDQTWDEAAKYLFEKWEHWNKFNFDQHANKRHLYATGQLEQIC